MDTKLKGDIAEQATILEALKRGWGVLEPVGDRLPYDLVFDINDQLVKIQVKRAWFNEKRQTYYVDTRRCKTNRRVMIQDTYDSSDFDFALVYISELNLFYIFPIDIFLSYGSTISLAEAENRQRKPRSVEYRNAWELLEKICSS